MLNGNRGDVVTVLFPFKEDARAKPRPAVIIRKDCADEYYICQITGTNRSDKLAGKWILRVSPAGIQMGIVEDCFVNYERRILLNHMFVFKRIGTYPFIDEFEDYLESIGENIY